MTFSGFMGEFCKVLLVFLAYSACVGIPLIVIRFTMKIPDFVFRKMMHLFAVCSVFPLAFATDLCWASVAVICVCLVVAVVMILIHENASFFNKLFVEKSTHEVAINFASFFILTAVLFSVFWGILGDKYKYIAVASIMAWGPGDGMAAIVGISSGKHKIKGKHIEGTKSVEGTAAMIITSFICTFLTLWFMKAFPWHRCFLIAAVVGVVSGFTELYTMNGWDTVSVPLAAAAIISLFQFVIYK